MVCLLIPEIVMHRDRPLGEEGPATSTGRCPAAKTARHGSDMVGFSSFAPVMARSWSSPRAYTTRPIPLQ
jgi:hypothetical protein